MTARNPATPSNWVDPDDGPEWTDEMMAMAELSIGGGVIRPATEVLTKDGMRPIGRPPLGDKARQPVTMRLPPHVLDYFRGTKPGWQRRVENVLEAHIKKGAAQR